MLLCWRLHVASAEEWNSSLERGVSFLGGNLVLFISVSLGPSLASPLMLVLCFKFSLVSQPAACTPPQVSPPGHNPLMVQVLVQCSWLLSSTLLLILVPSPPYPSSLPSLCLLKKTPFFFTLSTTLPQYIFSLRLITQSLTQFQLSALLLLPSMSLLSQCLLFFLYPAS